LLCNLFRNRCFPGASSSLAKMHTFYFDWGTILLAT